jgi:hypothetical protein
MTQPMKRLEFRFHVLVFAALAATASTSLAADPGHNPIGDEEEAK